jgi:LPS sulfotransferase NodH
MGFALEYFKRSHWKAWEKRAASDKPAIILQKLYERRTSPSGVFSCKIHWEHLAMIDNVGLMGLFKGAAVVIVQRSDILGQAISWSIAEQTNSWISTQEPVRSPVYSREAIDRHIRQIIEQEKSWRLLLLQLDIVPLVVNYEEFCHSPKTWVRRIAQIVEVRLPSQLKLKASPLQIQRTSEAERWRNVYLESMPFTAAKNIQRPKEEKGLVREESREE